VRLEKRNTKDEGWESEPVEIIGKMGASNCDILGSNPSRAKAIDAFSSMAALATSS